MSDDGAGPQPTIELDPEARAFYCQALGILSRSGVPYLVGGAYAFERYTAIARHTKDFDVFVRPEDAQRVLALFDSDTCRAELTFPHWLGKAFCGEHVVDVIFSSGNGVAEVDDEWFAHAVNAKVLGFDVKLVAPEEMIWQKSFIMERERYDGADVLHLLRTGLERLDWDRLLAHFGPDWRVLFSHLVLFGFVYPGERARIPRQVMEDLMQRLGSELATNAPIATLCKGTLLSREQYLVDLEAWGYLDARALPRVKMNDDHVRQWTEAISSPD